MGEDATLVPTRRALRPIPPLHPWPCNWPARRNAAQRRELHENRMNLERVFELLAKQGISVTDYALVQEESVSGDKLPTKYAWELKTQQDAATLRRSA